MSFAEARATALHAGVKVEVIDSVYVKRMQRGAVFVQNPVAGSKVRREEGFCLHINAVVPQKIPCPRWSAIPCVKPKQSCLHAD